MLTGYSRAAHAYALREMRRAEREAKTRAAEAEAAVEYQRQQAAADLRHDAHLRQLTGGEP